MGLIILVDARCTKEDMKIIHNITKKAKLVRFNHDKKSPSIYNQTFVKRMPQYEKN